MSQVLYQLYNNADFNLLLIESGQVSKVASHSYLSVKIQQLWKGVVDSMGGSFFVCLFLKDSKPGLLETAVTCIVLGS